MVLSSGLVFGLRSIIRSLDRTYAFYRTSPYIVWKWMQVVRGILLHTQNLYEAKHRVARSSHPPWMTPKALCHNIAKDFARKADENGQYFVSDGNSHGTRPSVRPLNGQSRYKFVKFSHIIFETIIVVPFMDTDSKNFQITYLKITKSIFDVSPLSHRYRLGHRSVAASE